MSFASIEFIIFFIASLLIVSALEHFNKLRLKEIYLLFASYFFYGYWDWRFCFLLFFVTATSFVAAKYNKNKAVYISGIVIPLVVLGIFKYFNFFLNSFAAILGQELGALQIILPVGISFYTFQALSYVIDVHRNKLEEEKDFFRLALYISFFPQLVAGPIVKAIEFLPQLKEDRRITFDNLKFGLQLMLFGLLKKMVLADHLSVFVDDIFAAPLAYHWGTIALAAVSYSLQIYFDFSGYSDIAIGCAKCFGYDFRANFNLPYVSKSVTEFWHRWHISLSTWLKEYLYISLGGNRKGLHRQYANLMTTMLLGGLWHGANWTFVFWGGINGLALCWDKFIGLKENTPWYRQLLSMITTFLFITFTWIFFRAPSFEVAWQVIRGIFTMQQGVVQIYAWSIVAIIALVISSVMAWLKAHREKLHQIESYYPVQNLDTVKGLTTFFVASGLLICLAYTGQSPFVYFQF